MNRLATAVGAILAVVVALVVVLISTRVGPIMGARAVLFHQPVEVDKVEVADGTIDIYLKSYALYPLHAQYGFSVIDQAGVVLYESPALDAGQMASHQTLKLTVDFPSGVTVMDWKLAAWAREAIKYLDEDAEQSRLIETNAIIRRAPMSIEGVTMNETDEGSYTLGVNLRLTGSTQTPVNIRYAISITRAVEQGNGRIAPVERVYLSDFTELVLIPEENRSLEAHIDIHLEPAQYAVTLWVQRETGTSGTYEHFAQFTYPELLLITE